MDFKVDVYNMSTWVQGLLGPLPRRLRPTSLYICTLQPQIHIVNNPFRVQKEKRYILILKVEYQYFSARVHKLIKRWNYMYINFIFKSSNYQIGSIIHGTQGHL